LSLAEFFDTYGNGIKNSGGHDLRKLEPKYRAKRLTIWTLDPIIQELRAIFKVHPEWFEVPKPKSDKGQNMVDYSIK